MTLERRKRKIWEKRKNGNDKEGNGNWKKGGEGRK